MAARLQQENAMATGGGETIGENAAGASSADDDIVEGVRMRPQFKKLHEKVQSIEPRGPKLPMNLLGINGFPASRSIDRQFY